MVFPALIALACLVGGIGWLLGRGHETTEDAQVEGRVVNVSARVGGVVARLLVEDNQLVEAGDLLVELDDRELSARLDAVRAERAAVAASLEVARTSLTLTESNAKATLAQARGGLTQAKAGITSTKAGLEVAHAAVAAAQTRVKFARLELDRVIQLRSTASVPDAQVDQLQAAYDEAVAAQNQAQAQNAAAAAATEGSSGGLTAAEGRILAAETVDQQVASSHAAVAMAEARLAQTDAAVRLAELNLSYTKVVAPVRGLVSRRAVEIGQSVSFERPLLALVPPDDIWVVANYKEDQIADMKPGQPARVRIDAYPGVEFAGHVESISGASGARFSLLPPDNASGNFVKVVQRLPVVIRLDGPPARPLRPGMSADVLVHTDQASTAVTKGPARVPALFAPVPGASPVPSAAPAP